MVSFFQIAISLLEYVTTFSGQPYFGRSYFFTLFQSNYLGTTVTFSGSYFFRTAAVFSFCRTATFSQELFFQNSFFFGAKILQHSHFLRIGSSLRQLFFSEKLFRIKISKKELLFQSRYFCTASTFSEKLHFGKNWFFRKSISALPTFSGELSF